MNRSSMTSPSTSTRTLCTRSRISTSSFCCIRIHTNPKRVSQSHAEHVTKVMCISWILAVTGEGTTIKASQMAGSSPPGPPDRPTVFSPLLRAWRRPRNTFRTLSRKSRSRWQRRPADPTPRSGARTTHRNPRSCRTRVSVEVSVGQTLWRRMALTALFVANHEFRRDMLSVRGAAAVAEKQ